MWVAALILYHREDEKSSLKLVTQLVTFLFRQSNIFKNCLWSHLSRFVFLLWDVKRDFIGILWIKLVWTWTITHPHVWVTSILNKNKTWQICIFLFLIEIIRAAHESWTKGHAVFDLLDTGGFRYETESGEVFSWVMSKQPSTSSEHWTRWRTTSNIDWCSFFACACVKCGWFKVRLRF